MTENVQRYMQAYSALSNHSITKHNYPPIDLDLIQTLEITDKLQAITPCPQWGDQNKNKLKIFFDRRLVCISSYFCTSFKAQILRVTAVILKVTHYIHLQSLLTDGKVFVSQGTLTGYDLQSF